jgi:putative toxin-antitoxin system antitoxin component (TIGR02293 family)
MFPRKTSSHRRKAGKLTPGQPDRLQRVERVTAAAEETFGSQEKASIWLWRPSAALGGNSPISLLDTIEGARSVEELLGRIDQGLGA